MNRYLLVMLFLPNILFSQETWNTMPPLSFAYNEITDMFVHNDTIVVYGTSIYSQSNPKQGLVVAQLDTNGTIIKEVFVADSMGDKLAVDEKWGDIIKTSDGGYAATTAPVDRNSAMLIKFDANLNITFIKEYVDTTLVSNFWYNLREVKNGYLLFGNQRIIGSVSMGFVKYVDYQGNMIWENNFLLFPKIHVFQTYNY